MINPNGTNFGACRRKTQPSIPDDRFVRETLLSRSDLSSSDKYYNKPAEHEHRHHSEGSMPLAMVYCPAQAFEGLYDEDVALSRGTLFSSLDLPFEGSKCSKERC